MFAPAIGDLAQFDRRKLFDTVSEGIKHIIENAGELNRSARKLFEIGEYRSAEIILGIAEEESAKVLILIDAIRCPPKRKKELSKTLKCFYEHLPKRIYSGMCEWKIACFDDVVRRVDGARKDMFLDGPNGVDWIFPNYRKTQREGNMYVDYVRDITVENGDRYWQTPVGPSRATYVTPKSYQIAEALHRVGATTSQGLDVVGTVWNDFEPEPNTSIRDLCSLNSYMLVLLESRGRLNDVESESAQIILQELPFPLWALDLRPLDRDTYKKHVVELRAERARYIEWWENRAKRRDPKPIVTRATVEELTRFYRVWEEEADRLIDTHPDNEQRSFGRIVTASLQAKLFNLPSYRAVVHALKKLSVEERMDLAALAWFGRNTGPPDWQAVHEYARKVPALTDHYLAGLGGEWMKGLERWESDPHLPASLQVRTPVDDAATSSRS